METVINRQKAYYMNGSTRSLTFRLNQLKQLKEVVKEYEEPLLEALLLDLNKPKEEAFLTEFAPVYQEITHVLTHLSKWIQPKKVKTPITHKGSKSIVYYEPHGLCLIIAPWNYPFHLAIAPLIGAIAGGNCAIIKPSELTPHTSKVIAEMIRTYFDDEYVKVIEGDVEVSQALLEQRFDHIFFTGSTKVGKIVMKAAAEHVTPVTLELGGKSPAIVDRSAKLDLAAKRIAWGKFLNAGQTCVAPDYVLVHEEVLDSFLPLLKKHTQKLFSKRVRQKRYPKIVSERHLKRLVSFLEDGEIVVGGEVDAENDLLSPTILTNVAWDASIMQEEIFGPILPIFSYTSTEDCMEKVNRNPNPLALYVFSETKEFQELMTQHISFGGGCINDTIMHLATPHLPFGGKGESGIGAYHGYESFLTFTTKKSLLKQATNFDIPFRYKQGSVLLSLLRKWVK
ncbi:aldehyde dehydrogenase [Halalkalibacter hemicellulosilyticusJCM 9152]|uniref:Aldehyde dehydrogenase n=2 Tax=Halalkalibacter TaxID=2893056 RepID=W4QHH1_9BACI|nr:aldehyde dehydrogenase [Halalkalibacter hemicellulosilyticusJCM 9152]